MNRQQWELQRSENLKLLDRPAYKVHENEIVYSPSESVEHIMAKTICFILLRNGVPANFLNKRIGTEETTKSSIYRDDLPSFIQDTIDRFGQKFKHEWQRPSWVCEARFKATDVKINESEICTHSLFKRENKKCPRCSSGIVRRTADWFGAHTGEIVEIETNPKETKAGDNVITVRI